MAVTVVPVNSGLQSGGFTLPDYCSFCVSNSGGASGQVLINGLGVNDPTVSGAFDLKTIFTSAGFLFRSYPLLRAFRAIGSATAAQDQFLQNLQITSFLMNSVGGTTVIGVNYLWGIGGGPADAPYIGISVPDTSAIWRVDFKLRHSVTN